MQLTGWIGQGVVFWDVAEHGNTTNQTSLFSSGFILFHFNFVSPGNECCLSAVWPVSTRLHQWLAVWKITNFPLVFVKSRGWLGNL